MSDENELKVVFRTSQYDEAALLCSMLGDARMKSIGAEPHEEAPAADEEADALLPCPNCETVGLTLRKACAGCGYEILASDAPPVFVNEHAPGSRSFCPECRDPLTFPSGECRACGTELEPLESGDRLASRNLIGQAVRRGPKDPCGRKEDSAILLAEALPLRTVANQCGVPQG